MNNYIPIHYNESTILEFVTQGAEVSRSKLVKSTNLTKSFISDITKTLVEKSSVYKSNTGVASASSSRKPICLSFSNEYALAITIETRKDCTHSSLPYISGELVNKLSYHSLLVTEDIPVMLLTEMISDLVSRIPQTPYGISGIGMIIHGIVKDDIVLFTPYSGIDSIPLKDLLAKEIPYPIVLISEANAGALGEYTSRTPLESLVSINIQDGIGVSIAENGKLLIGANGTAGEIGHTTLYPDDILCPCGNHGCLEYYASTRILLKKLFDSDHKPRPDISVTVKEWHQGDACIQKILRHDAELLSIDINNIVLVHDPEIVIINSEIYRGIPELIDEIKKRLTGKNTKNLTIKNISPEGNSTLYGCVSIVAQPFLKVDSLKLIVQSDRKTSSLKLPIFWEGTTLLGCKYLAAFFSLNDFS